MCERMAVWWWQLFNLKLDLDATSLIQNEIQFVCFFEKRTVKEQVKGNSSFSVLGFATASAMENLHSQQRVYACFFTVNVNERFFFCCSSVANVFAVI